MIHWTKPAWTAHTRLESPRQNSTREGPSKRASKIPADRSLTAAKQSTQTPHPRTTRTPGKPIPHSQLSTHLRPGPTQARRPHHNRNTGKQSRSTHKDRETAEQNTHPGGTARGPTPTQPARENTRRRGNTHPHPGQNTRTSLPPGRNGRTKRHFQHELGATPYVMTHTLIPARERGARTYRTRPQSRTPSLVRLPGQQPGRHPVPTPRRPTPTPTTPKRERSSKAAL